MLVLVIRGYSKQSDHHRGNPSLAIRCGFYVIRCTHLIGMLLQYVMRLPWDLIRRNRHVFEERASGVYSTRGFSPQALIHLP